MTCIRSQADLLIPKPTNKFVFKKAGKTQDIIDEILSEDKRAHTYTRDFAPTLDKGDVYQTCREVWNFVKCNIRYQLDPIGKQFIKTPAQTWHDKFADCKSFSLFIASILKNLGIPYSYRFTSYRKSDPDPTHVYIVVPYQNSEIIIDGVMGRFNTQKPYQHKKDFKMTKIYVVEGTGKEGILQLNKPIDQISDAEMSLLIAKQALEIDKQNFLRAGGVSGIGALKAERVQDQLDVINDTLEVLNDKSLSPDEKEEEIIYGIGGDAEDGLYSICCNGAISGGRSRETLARQRRRGRRLRIQRRKAIGSIGKVRKTKLGKFLQKVSKGAKEVVKAVTKVVTAPARLAVKGILEATLPSAAPMFLYLFITDPNVIAKLPPKMAAKRRKQEKIANFIVDKIGMKRDHFMGIVRNGIAKRYGTSPEAVLSKQLKGIAGVGVLPAAAVGLAAKALMTILDKLFKLFGKKEPDMEVSESDFPDPALDAAELNAAQKADLGAGVQNQEDDDENFNAGGRRRTGWC